jgi:hypothetical protein
MTGFRKYYNASVDSAILVTYGMQHYRDPEEYLKLSKEHFLPHASSFVIHYIALKHM